MGSSCLFDGDGGQQTVSVGGINQQVVGLFFAGVVGVILQVFFAVERIFRIFQDERIVLLLGQFTFTEFLEFLQHIAHAYDVGLAFHLYAFPVSYGRHFDAGSFQVEIGSRSVGSTHSVQIARAASVSVVITFIITS